jgi:hypothetical protein
MREEMIMTGGPIAAITANSMNVPMPSVAAEPTAEQTARFEQLLQQPHLNAEPIHYASPSAEATGLGRDFHAIVDYVGQASTRINSDLGKPTPHIDVRDLPPELQEELQLQRELSERVHDMGNATLQLAMVGKGVELAESLPRVLYQQG